MYPSEPEKKSNRIVWIVAASVVVLFVVIGGAIYAFIQAPNNQKQSVTTGSTATTGVASKDEVRQSLTDVNSSIDQAKKDQSAFSETINDNKKQIKVGS